MTPNEITTLLATDLKKELDVPFKKMLYERVKYWRSTLIKQSLDKVRKDSHYFRQTIYIPMERIGLEGAPELQQFRSRTTVRVPIPIRISDQVFDYVGGIDGKSPFGFADEGFLGYMKAGKYAKKFGYAKYENRRIATEDYPNLGLVRISGIFNSPEEALVYESVPANPIVNFWDEDIPMSGDIEQRVVQCIMNTDYAKAKETGEKTDDYQVPVNNEKL